ncbi:MAG TPA: restriction endonuclease [Solirubrobacteraceae bacterium]|nr:restriction endonuclease [Solirubrobacteraceae bacterium]
MFEVLAEHPDGMRAKDVLAATEARLTLTDYEAGTFEASGVRRFEKLVRFQTLNAVKAGWMVKDKGTWTATEDGLAALAQYPDPETFMAHAEAEYRAWAKKQPGKPKPGAGDGDGAGSETESEDETVVSVTVEEAEETAFADIERHLATMSPYDLQELVAALLRGMGYHVSWVSPPGKDRGLDILAFRDPLGTEDPRIKVQVKREQSKTDVKGLRAFMSLLNPGDVGVFVTLGGFTSDAESEARNSETRRLSLVDESELLDLWVRYYDRIPAEGRALLPLKPVYFLDETSDRG